MDTLNGIIEQIKTHWNRSTPAGRAAIVLVALISITVVSGVGYWSAQPQYIALATNLSPTEAANIVSALNTNSIPNKTDFAGSAVMVPNSRWSEARLAASDQLGASDVSPEASGMGSSIFDGSSQTHHRLLRAKEAQLEQSILRMRAISSADVHIAQPKWTPMIRDQQPTTASVVIGVRPSASITRTQARSIVQMVAASVEGLTPESVTVTDLNGNSITPNTDGDGGFLGRLEMQHRIEAEAVAKAESMLEPMLGLGKAVVKVTAEVDFTERTTNSKTYDPSVKVKGQEKIETSNSTGQAQTPSGPAGTGSNLAVNPVGTGNGAVGTSQESETIDTTYLNAETTEQTKQVAGTLKRLTIAAAVDLTPDPNAAPDATVPTLADIEETIKFAVGFKDERNDKIKVISSTFALNTDQQIDETLAGINQWEMATTLIRHSSLGLAAIVALLVLNLALRKMKPVTVVVDRTDPETQRAQVLSKMTDQIQQNPEAVSKILSAWMGDADDNATVKKAA